MSKTTDATAFSDGSWPHSNPPLPVPNKRCTRKLSSRALRETPGSRACAARCEAARLLQ